MNKSATLLLPRVCVKCMSQAKNTVQRFHHYLEIKIILSPDMTENLITVWLFLVSSSSYLKIA